MRRRAFLASALTAGTALTPGCGVIHPRTEHSNPTEKTDENPRDDIQYLAFRADGSDLADVGVTPPSLDVPSEFATSIWHRDGTELRSLTQRFATPGTEGSRPWPTLALEGPFMGDREPHPSVSLSRTQDGTAAVLEVHEFGELADETVTINLIVTRWPESARTLVVESTAELAETGPREETHVLEGRLEFALADGTGGEERSDEPPQSPS
ncbi:hypothetical protein [Halorientalis halophila]|uniref:hypothetical protein n=1 Tax=Halorientalis halophila TaxID=3108499 RepID=UPI003008EDAF